MYSCLDSIYNIQNATEKRAKSQQQIYTDRQSKKQTYNSMMAENITIIKALLLSTAQWIKKKRN